MNTVAKTTQPAAPLKAVARPAAPAPQAPARPAFVADDLILDRARATADAELAKLDRQTARRDALEAKLGKLRNASQASFLLGFCSMFGAAAAGPALPYVMGVGLLAMTVVPATMALLGGGARKELRAIDAELGVY